LAHVTDCIELAGYEWLIGPQAAEALADLAGRREPLHITAARLRRQFSAAQAHLLLEQTDLRRRADSKFSQAESMFFTSLGLEQATDEWVARYRASRFAGRGPIADLCCGIGGDLLALAGQGPVVGVDRDPIAACLALANARAVLPPEVSAHTTLAITDASKFEITDFAAWHLDPDRRPNGSRTTSLEWSDPDQSVVERLLAVVPNAAIKLAPAAEVSEDWADRCELEWISRDRQCRQLVVWHGVLADSPGRRRATILSNDGTLHRTVGDPNAPIPIAQRLCRYLYEPDAAVLAAHLTGVLASQYELERISPGIAYLTGDNAIDDPAIACFEIEDQLPLEKRSLASYLRERGIGTLEIKKRGVDIEPEKLRRELKLRGDNSATLILTPLSGKQVAIFCRRIVNAIGNDAQCLSLATEP
jgi:predicted RNA methylase